MQLQCADEDACRWRWLALRPGAEDAEPSVGSNQGQGGSVAAGAPPSKSGAWQEVGTGRVYTPAEEDAGGWLRVECTPVARHGAHTMPLSTYSLSYPVTTRLARETRCPLVEKEFLGRARTTVLLQVPQ